MAAPTSVDREPGKTKLSIYVRQMKFMQRNKDATNVEEEQEQQRRIDDSHWVLDLPELQAKQTKFTIEPSYVTCEDLKYGRMSFKGFNPAIEKLMKQQDTEQELNLAEEREKKVAVSDEEMAERYDSLVGTIGKKFTKKRHRSSQEEENGGKKKKKAFLKPADD
ncbi:M-phase phosphoprotein 6-like [Ptychodera flava]|uniref:M-phase phosphoprotein 6-like n=1 Tax=Ptychodera flava TaxID=63121 RepID=UPI00396A80AA